MLQENQPHIHEKISILQAKTTTWKHTICSNMHWHLQEKNFINLLVLKNLMKNQQINKDSKKKEQ